MAGDEDDDIRDEDARWEAENEAAEDAHNEEVGQRYVEDNAEELAEDFFEANYDKAVQVFSTARLQHYYLQNTDIAVPALGALKYARLLLPGFPQAALVFAVSSVEITLKYGVLRPAISGLIHAEELASLIADEATSGPGIVRYNKLLKGILNQITKVKLSERKRVDSKTTLWEEICTIQTARNKLIHEGLIAEIATVELSIAVAGAILNDVFPEILKSFGLYLRDSLICDEPLPETKPPKT